MPADHACTCMRVECSRLLQSPGDVTRDELDGASQTTLPDPLMLATAKRANSRAGAVHVWAFLPANCSGGVVKTNRWKNNTSAELIDRHWTRTWCMSNAVSRSFSSQAQERRPAPPLVSRRPIPPRPCPYPPPSPPHNLALVSARRPPPPGRPYPRRSPKSYPRDRAS